MTKCEGCSNTQVVKRVPSGLHDGWPDEFVADVALGELVLVHGRPLFACHSLPDKLPSPTTGKDGRFGAA